MRSDPRASGTVYGTHFPIRFTHKPTGPTTVLLADAPGETAQAEVRKHNLFASRSNSPSSATLPTLGQAGSSAQGDSPRVAGSLLRDPRRAKQVFVGAQLSSITDPAESPMKETSKATPSGVQVGVGERESVPTRQDSV